MKKSCTTSTVRSDESPKLIRTSGREDDWHLNACVGRNTGLNDNSIGYSEGFRTAAELMLRLLGVASPLHADETWGKNPLIDVLVYPICYAARHHVELAIKRALPRAWKIFKIRSPTDSHQLSEPRENELTHSVASIWGKLDAICFHADSKLSVLVGELKPYVLELDEFDRSGQTFRYASNSEDSQPHLADVSHINLQHFANGYADLCGILEKIEYRIEDVMFELSAGAFTSKLSRDDLVEIAKQLPVRDQWKSIAFSAAKEKILSDYSLSSNDFQRACKVIEEKRALAHLIGIVIPIEGLKPDTFSRLRRISKGGKTDLALLSLEERSVIFALLQIGSFPPYPEQFESYLGPRPTDKDGASQFESERAPNQLSRRVCNSPQIVERALIALGQNDLACDFREVFKNEIKKREARLKLTKDLNFEKFFRYLGKKHNKKKAKIM